MAKSPGRRAGTPRDRDRNDATATPARPARERTVQSSVSLRPSQWDRLDVLGDLTQWGRSGALSQAVDLLTSLPLPVTQRLATLSRTTVRGTLHQRLRAAVEEALAAAEAELPEGPWAEFDAALAAAGEEFRGSEAADLTEAELTAAARRAKEQVRREKRERRDRAGAAARR